MAWASTFAVGVVIMAIALAMAGGGHSVFGSMVTFNTVMSLAYGPPALLGLVVRRTPSWSGFAAFAVALAVGAVGSFVLGWGLVTNVLTVVPASVAVFFLSRLFPEKDPARTARRDDLFRRLDTPVDVATELRDTHDPTAQVFRFLSRVIGLVGVLCVPLVFSAPAEERATVIGYVVITLALATALAFVKGKTPGAIPGHRGGRAMRRTIPWSALAFLLATTPATAGVASVWAVGDGDKVARDAVGSPLAKGNAAWDGRTVRLAAARNEIVAFQVIVEADGSGIRRSLRGSAGAAAPRRERADRLRAARRRPDAVRQPADPAVLRARHERHGGDPRLLGVDAGEPRRAARHRRLAAGAARARERPRRPRRVPARGRAPALAQAIWIEVYVGRDASGGDLRRSDRSHRRRANGASLPVELRVFGFSAARREQPAGDGLLRVRPARALPGAEPRPGLPPLRAPPADRARARLRRGDGGGEPRAASTGATSRRTAGYEGPGRGRRQHDRPASVLRDRPRVRAEGERLEALRRVDGVRVADAARKR